MDRNLNRFKFYLIIIERISKNEDEDFIFVC